MCLTLSFIIAKGLTEPIKVPTFWLNGREITHRGWWAKATPKQKEQSQQFIKHLNPK